MFDCWAHHFQKHSARDTLSVAVLDEAAAHHMTSWSRHHPDVVTIDETHLPHHTLMQATANSSINTNSKTHSTSQQHQTLQHTTSHKPGDVSQWPSPLYARRLWTAIRARLLEG